MIQILEDALSHLIVLKTTEPSEKSKADSLFRKYEAFTFGRALNEAKEKSLLPKSLEIELTELKEDRNWLIHKSITENKEEYRTESFYKKLFERTELISRKAQELRLDIEMNLISYCEEKNINVEKIKKKMKEHYGAYS